MRNSFLAKEMSEKAAFPPGNLGSADNRERIGERAEKIISDPNHQITQLIQRPYWVKDAILGEEEKLKDSFKENLVRAAEIISEETGYEPGLIIKVYKLYNEKLFQEKPPQERKKLH